MSNTDALSYIVLNTLFLYFLKCSFICKRVRNECKITCHERHSYGTVVYKGDAVPLQFFLF